jgi:hypothetical protein
MWRAIQTPISIYVDSSVSACASHPNEFETANLLGSVSANLISTPYQHTLKQQQRQSKARK